MWNIGLNLKSMSISLNVHVHFLVHVLFVLLLLLLLIWTVVVTNFGQGERISVISDKHFFLYSVPYGFIFV
jgi:hypothetical protein